MTVVLHSWAASDTGPTRSHNEDAFVDRPDLGVWAVADGAGGHQAGEYASGLIAAGGIVGLLGVAVKLYEAATDRSIPRFSDLNPLHHDWISVLMFAMLAFSLYYFARKPLDTEE